MSVINNIIAREILDSRGNPTIEVDVILESGCFGRASVPSGASTGSKEAVELRDNDTNYYDGKGVTKAIKYIHNEISKICIGRTSSKDKQLEKALIKLDGTKNKSKLGANSLLGVSMALMRANAAEKLQPLFEYIHKGSKYIMPVPMMNVINGGQHAANNIDMQEFMIIPAGFLTFKDALRCSVEIFHTLKKVLIANNYNVAGVGDEGGYAPNLPSNEKAIEMIILAIQESGYKAGEQVFIGLDLAASEFYKDGKYHLKSENTSLSSAEFVDLLGEWVDKYPIISIEDALDENDWDGWKILTNKIGHKVQLVGDDLFVTNSNLLKKGIENKIANAILIKPNQIGTVSETLATIKLAQENDYAVIISHRSGETSDTFIADLSVGVNATQIKTGSLCRSDRVGKYNQLLRIEESLGGKAVYPGLKAFKNYK